MVVFRTMSLLLGIALCGGALGAELPRVDAVIDPTKSFWAEHVHYAYPHQFARVADGQGRMWELAYLDIYRGEAAQKAKAPVLVLLHGRSMNSGYWGELLEQPLAGGWRVVSIDWTHSGKSLPRNLELPVVRSFDDVRELVHNLVVKQLGIARASYLGHSLGGQVAAGYALRYPESVERLVLYASGGLGTIMPIEINRFLFDDPDLLIHPERFLQALKTGILPSMGATQEEVEASFYKPARMGSLPYLKRGGPLSPFMVASRAGVLRGEPRERERFQQAYAWDSLASLAECRLGDAQSLPNRIVLLEVPTMVALGFKDPIVPVDCAQPLHLSARIHQAPIQIKLYANAGHFIHTDLPGPFTADVLAFLHSGTVPGPLFDGVFATRTPLAATELPKDLRRFKERAVQAYASHDLEEIRRNVFHPESLEDGQTLKERLAIVASALPNMTSWDLAIYGFKYEGDKLTVDAEIRNSYGVYPWLMVLKQMDGEWLSYGNQN
ncbi:MAG TPA: alpha/beta hydrolase [Geothrix sp.]